MDTKFPRGISIHPNPRVPGDPKFMLQARHLALTYPRCSLSRQEFLDGVKDRLPPFSKYLIAQEKHDDPEVAPLETKLHLHVYLEMEEKIRTRDCRFADVYQYHGKYESVKILKDWIAYCTKEDATPLANFDWKIFLKGKTAKPSRRAVIGAELVNNRIPLEELIPTNPELIFGYKKLKLDLLEFKNDTFISAVRRVQAFWYYGPTRLGKSWKALCERAFLRVETDPATGRSSLEGDFSKIYFKNAQNKWFDGYNGQPILFIDELPIEAAKWNINYVKQWTDSIPYFPEVKGSRCPAQWTTVIVTCQHSIRDYFNGLPEPDIQAVIARFLQIQISVKQY